MITKEDLKNGGFNSDIVRSDLDGDALESYQFNNARIAAGNGYFF